MSAATNPCCHSFSFRFAPSNSGFSIRVHLKPLLPCFPLNSNIHCVSTLSRRCRNVSPFSLSLPPETRIYGFRYINSSGSSVRLWFFSIESWNWFTRIFTGGLFLLLHRIVFSLKKWEILCFRREESSPENIESKSAEEKLAEDLVATPEVSQSSETRKDWVSSLYKVNICSHPLNVFILFNFRGFYFLSLLNGSSVSCLFKSRNEVYVFMLCMDEIGNIKLDERKLDGVNKITVSPKVIK